MVNVFVHLQILFRCLIFSPNWRVSTCQLPLVGLLGGGRAGDFLTHSIRLFYGSFFMILWSLHVWVRLLFMPIKPQAFAWHSQVGVYHILEWILHGRLQAVFEYLWSYYVFFFCKPSWHMIVLEDPKLTWLSKYFAVYSFAHIRLGQH